MRDIRFRVWDIGNNRMVYDPDRFDPAYSPDEKEISDWTFYETWQDREDGIKRSCHVMQLTGLKDKNGKEIYEGDIISYFDKIVAVVVWQDYGGWSYQWIDPTYIKVRQHNPEPFFHNISLAEVVGNVYEHPELLKQF